jgi:hypothetical protein
MSRYVQRFLPRCMTCKRAKRPYNAIETIRQTDNGAWVRCKTCGRESYRRSWAAKHRSMKPQPPQPDANG